MSLSQPSKSSSDRVSIRRELDLAKTLATEREGRASLPFRRGDCLAAMRLRLWAWEPATPTASSDVRRGREHRSLTVGCRT